MWVSTFWTIITSVSINFRIFIVRYKLGMNVIGLLLPLYTRILWFLYSSSLVSKAPARIQICSQLIFSLALNVKIWQLSGCFSPFSTTNVSSSTWTISRSTNSAEQMTSSSCYSPLSSIMTLKFFSACRDWVRHWTGTIKGLLMKVDRMINLPTGVFII